MDTFQSSRRSFEVVYGKAVSRLPTTLQFQREAISHTMVYHKVRFFQMRST